MSSWKKFNETLSGKILIHCPKKILRRCLNNHNAASWKKCITALSGEQIDLLSEKNETVSQ
jgi:hypothetical protein